MITDMLLGAVLTVTGVMALSAVRHVSVALSQGREMTNQVRESASEFERVQNLNWMHVELEAGEYEFTSEINRVVQDISPRTKRIFFRNEEGKIVFDGYKYDDF